MLNREACRRFLGKARFLFGWVLRDRPVGEQCLLAVRLPSVNYKPANMFLEERDKALHGWNLGKASLNPHRSHALWPDPVSGKGFSLRANVFDGAPLIAHRAPPSPFYCIGTKRTS